MKKYRIKQIGDKFYPQYRFLFFWFKFSYQTYIEIGLQTHIDSRYHFFNSLEEAKNFLDKEKRITIHPYEN